MATPYHRYHIDTKKAPNIIPHPHRFHVDVNKFGLAKLLLKELIEYKGNLNVVLSRPCVYGVFSGPFGGFFPRQHLCVGCLRCTTEHPDFVTVSKNPERDQLGDSYYSPEYVDTTVHEAETGRIPIKGAGYRGTFGGSGWDGMWTDMSEIVRPTRDGIHGREFISTEVEIGSRPPFLQFDAFKKPIGKLPDTVSIPLPLMFDHLPLYDTNKVVAHTVAGAAHQLQTFAILSFDAIRKHNLRGRHLIPLISPMEIDLFLSYGLETTFVEMDGWDLNVYQKLISQSPHTQVILRTGFSNALLEVFQAGVRIFHLIADYHGQDGDGRFVLDLIRETHLAFVKENCRDEVTLIGSGGMIAAEHMAKAIICGLDVVAVDIPVLVALQGRFQTICRNRKESVIQMPKKMDEEWGKQRLKNLFGSWHDQLLEVMGAMGLREVRRMRGELGRAMFQKDLEKEAFAGIEGYEERAR